MKERGEGGKEGEEGRKVVRDRQRQLGLILTLIVGAESTVNRVQMYQKDQAF